jgi:hypothetical protein
VRGHHRHGRFVGNGGIINGVTIQSTEFGYGLFATKHLRVGEEYIRVPANVCLSEIQANQSVVVGPVIKYGYSNPIIGKNITCHYAMSAWLNDACGGSTKVEHVSVRCPACHA